MDTEKENRKMDFKVSLGSEAPMYEGRLVGSLYIHTTFTLSIVPIRVSIHTYGLNYSYTLGLGFCVQGPFLVLIHFDPF